MSAPLPPLAPLPLVQPLVAWYAANARDLPWRRPGTTPYAVLVSEVMLQQTPVVRVVPAYDAWLARWPSARELAGAEPGEAVRMWGRLGYPRRALRLHAAAVAIVERHDGEVPSEVPTLEALPGVGGYTARAVAAFGHGRRAIALDTNVRRVLARLLDGASDAPATTSAAEQRRADALLPPDDATAATFAIGLMELGATVCTPRTPRCADCPLAASCAWRAAGKPETPGVGRRPQAYAGTDRQVRGRLLAVVREADAPVSRTALDAVWHDAEQRERALTGLLTDGLVELRSDGSFALPGDPGRATSS